MGRTIAGGHDKSIERALAGGWNYDCECPEAGVGWTRLKRTRDCPSHRDGIRVDFEYVAPDGKRFRSLVSARFYSTTGVEVKRGATTSAKRFQDCAVACAACASDEDAPGNDIVICDGACGLAFHQHCLVEPLWAVPEDKWLCPGCIEESISRLPRFHELSFTSSEPPSGEPSCEPRLYELDPHALRPSCTNNRCGGAVYGGEMRHAPVECDATAFRCELCGTQLKSRWW